jgi:hypothetical protein
MFMWRKANNPVWRIWDNCLLVILRPDDGKAYALKPVGTGDIQAAIELLFRALAEISDDPMICRVDKDFIEERFDPDNYIIEKDRDNSDYVYRSEDLIELSGNKYHSKRNHLNKFMKNYDYEYKDLNQGLVDSFLELQEEWCELKDCALNPGLRKEDTAIYEALLNYKDLNFIGGAIEIDSKVEAYTLGENLNDNTAVIHVEKANPEIPEMYVAINNLFVSANWADVEYVNREQDLGIPGIRKAKESYNPDHMVHKYSVRPK